MNFKKIRNFRFSWLIILALCLFYGCTDLEFTEKDKLPNGDIDLSSRAGLSKKLLDSTNNAERLIVDSFNSAEQSNAQLNATSTLVNYALQATVTAESTYPGYSVLKIKDGSRNTTVGPLL